MKNGFSTIFLIVFLLQKDLSATITQGPSNTVAVAEIGKQVKLNCTATAAIAYWFLSKNGVVADEVTITGPGCSALNPAFSDHYAVESLGGGFTCNLIVSNITMEQAGVYRCSEAGNQLLSILTVTDSSPVITVNNTNGTTTVVEKQCVIFECALNHNGSVAPAPTLRPYFYWTDFNGQNVSSSYDSTTANTAVSQITVTADRQNITSYTCHVYLQLIPTTTPTYAGNTPTVSSSASSTVIEVLYYPEITKIASSVSTADNCVYKPESLTCTADANPPAQYEWLDLSNNAMTTGAVKSITSGGQYQCIAYNVIRTKRYDDTEIANETTCYSPYNLTITGPSCANNSCTCAVNQTEVKLTCMAEGNPNVTYQWRSDVFGYEDLESQANIEATFDGNYICTATNTFGNQPHSETVSVLVFSCRAPPMSTTTQSATKLSTIDPTATRPSVVTTLPPSGVPIPALVGAIIGCVLTVNIIATVLFMIYYNAAGNPHSATNDRSGHSKTKRNKTRLNKRFPWLQKMLPCLNDTKEGAGTNCLWVSLFILLGTFTGIATFPICILLAIKSEKNLETSALNKRENSEENGSAANGRRPVNSLHSPSQPGNHTRAVNPYQNESRENIELSSSHHSRNLLLTDSPTSNTPPKGKPPPLPNKPTPNTHKTPGRAQNYVVTEPAAMDPNHTTYADLPFMPHVPPTRPVQYLDGAEDAYAELKKT